MKNDPPKKNNDGNLKNPTKAALEVESLEDMILLSASSGCDFTPVEYVDDCGDDIHASKENFAKPVSGCDDTSAPHEVKQDQIDIIDYSKNDLIGGDGEQSAYVAPPVTQEPHPETPVMEEPHPETPVMEEPHPETPVYEEPHPETPVMEEPHPEPPVYEEPHPEPPVMEEPHPEPPVYEEPHPETPVYEEPHPEPPVMEEPHPEPPVYEEPHPEPPVYGRAAS